MLEDEGHPGAGLRKMRCVGHLRCEHLQIKTPAVVGEARDVAANHGIDAEIGPCRETVERVLVPVQLHAHAAHQRIALEAVELRADVFDGEIGIGDDRMRPAVLGGGLLHPGGLVLEVLIGPVGLHIDRARDAGALEVVEIFLDRVIAPDRLVGAEDARLHRSGEPGQVGLPPDVMVAVDDFAHATLLRPNASTCATIDALDPPSTRSSTKRSMATSASVCGRKPGPVASGVSQLTRQARRESLATASRSASGSPRSSPSETTTTAAPRPSPPNRGTARKACSASPIRVPPSQSLTRCAAAFSACSRRFIRSARVTRVSRVPKVKTSALGAACTSAWASFILSSVRLFIEPETSISSRNFRGR